MTKLKVDMTIWGVVDESNHPKIGRSYYGVCVESIDKDEGTFVGRWTAGPYADQTKTFPINQGKSDLWRFNW